MTPFRTGPVMPIRRYLNDKAVFDQAAIEAMSEALERACAALRVSGDDRGREIIAARIIDLARKGVVEAETLANRIIEAMRSL
jgi:hypothetical protein